MMRNLLLSLQFLTSTSPSFAESLGVSHLLPVEASPLKQDPIK